MATRSGVVLDFNTLTGVSGSLVYSLTVTGTYFTDIVITSGDGTFSITIDDSQDVIYIPFKDGYKGQYKQTDPSVSGVELYLYTASGIPASGSVFTNLVGAPIVTSTGVIDVIATLCNLFVITNSGLDIIENNTLDNYGYSLYSGGYTAIHLDASICEDIDIYLGTALSGVQRIIYSNTDGNVGNISVSGVTVVSGSSIVGPYINGIYVNNNREIAIATNSGINFVSADFGSVYYHQTPVEVTSCYITEIGDVYYSPAGSGIYVKYAPISANWTQPDYYLDDITIPSISGLYLNDIEVNPAFSGGNNQIFIATDSGIGVYNEDRTNISGSELKWFYAGVSGSSVLSGIAREFTGIEIDSDCSISGGRILLSSLLSGYEAVEDLDIYQIQDFSPVQLFDIENEQVLQIYRDLSFETNLRRLGLSFLGSKFLDRK